MYMGVTCMSQAVHVPRMLAVKDRSSRSLRPAPSLQLLDSFRAATIASD